MAEHRARATGENRSQALAELGEIGVPDRVDAGMHPVPVPNFHRPFNLPLRIAEWAEQLTNRDHAVLPLRQPGQRPMPPLPVWSPFPTHRG